MSCGYTGSHFGAHYPDAICIDGYLWDLDSCDVPGGPLFHGGDDACPSCNTRARVEQFIDDYPGWRRGNAHQRRKMRRKLFRRIKQRLETQ